MMTVDIKYIYNQLKKIAKQTGASKIMALKNSNLFVMWDSEFLNIDIKIGLCLPCKINVYTKDGQK